jgi:uncharacterized membrane protein YqaE (UPF0057 family)
MVVVSSSRVPLHTTRSQQYPLTNPLPKQIGCCEAIIAIFLPPLAVLMRKGCTGSLVLNIVLTILGWIPGVIHAWFVIVADPGLRRKHQYSSSSHSRPHSRPHSSGHHSHHSHSHHHRSSSSHSHAGNHSHHHHGGHGYGPSHTGRHHARPARKSYDRPVYDDGYAAAAPPARYGIGAPPPQMGYAAPPPPMGYAPPMRSRY